MKILVLGGEGMLGHKVYQTLLARFPDTGCTIRGSLDAPFYRRIDLFRDGRVVDGVDAMDLPALERVLRDLKPGFIVNCVGVVKQREEAKAAVPSITLNSLLPHKLVEFAAGWGGRVIHVSTDCVFSGKRGDGIRLENRRTPENGGEERLCAEERRHYDHRGHGIPEEKVYIEKRVLELPGPCGVPVEESDASFLLLEVGQAASRHHVHLS